MDILYIANMRIPTEKAHGLQIFQMMQAFSESGASVKLAVPTLRKGISKKEKQDPNDYYSLRKLVDWIRLPAIDFVRAVPSWLPWEANLKFVGNIAEILTFVCSLYVYLFLVRKKNQIIYIRDPNIAHLLVPLLKITKQKIWLELHHIPESEEKQRRYHKILNKMDGTIFLNLAMKEKLFQHGEPLCRYDICHDAVDDKVFHENYSQSEARKNLHLPVGKSIGAYVGRFHTNGMEKGIPEIIGSARDVLSYDPDFLFVFVGGPLDHVDEYLSLISHYGLPKKNFLFRDRISSYKVPEMLSASDFLLMPHPNKFYYRYCVSPLKLFEYMSSYRPIIASSLPTIQEVLTHERNSLLGKAGDSNDIASNILRLLEEPELARKLASQARKDVISYTWKKRAQKILNLMS